MGCVCLCMEWMSYANGEKIVERETFIDSTRVKSAVLKEKCGEGPRLSSCGSSCSAG